MDSVSATRLDDVLKLGPDAMLVGRAGRVVAANDRAEAMFGYCKGELPGRELESLILEWSRAACGEASVDFDLTGRHKDGREFPAEVTCRRLEASGEPLVALAVRDASERRRVEDSLRVRERRQAAIAELGHMALTRTDLSPLMDEAVGLVGSQLAVEFCNVLELLSDGRVVDRAGTGWTGAQTDWAATEARSSIPAAEVLRTQEPVVVDDLASDARFPDATQLRARGVVSSLNVPLYGHQRPFGVLGAHATHRREFSDEDVAFARSVANVLSAAIERQWLEQRQREGQLLRAEQMMAIGQVAAGVAHELRNPLTSIKGLVQVNLREAVAQGLPAEDLVVIEHEVRRMERTLQTFLDFARPPKPDRRPLNLADVVERVLALVGGRAKKQLVALTVEQPDASVPVEADRDQLQQLLLNLVLNALDALPDGGRVEIDLRPPRDGFVELSVRDTGPGIAPNILPKVFETFVSSKETGVGLGLPVSKRIAEDHGGSLSAYNLPGGGACFVLRLPAPD